MEIDKEYNDIVDIVITKFLFGRWITFMLQKLRQEILRKDGNEYNVKIVNIILGDLGGASPPPILIEMNVRSFFLNKYFQRIISHKYYSTKSYLTK